MQVLSIRVRLRCVGKECGGSLFVRTTVVGMSISGLVVEYIVAIDVTRVRFPADAFCMVP